MTSPHVGKLTFSAIEPGAGLKKALSISRSDVIREIASSGLKGRGGAGFPTDVKWNLAAAAQAPEKFVVCNADEGEPGTFKDRVILDCFADLVFEGMTLAGYVIGAKIGILYLRQEYSYLRQKIQDTLDRRRKEGLLGPNAAGKAGFDFDIAIRLGAGAYVCGEETALLESIEGRRGESQMKPPFPPMQGLMGQPTVINNVETLANVPHIIAKGAAWYNGIGTSQSRGTKIFSPCGDVQYPGVYEVPFGTTLREIIFGMAGGIKRGRKFKAVLMGGPSGVLVGEESLDRRLCGEDLNPGAGALIVLDESKCIVDLMRNCAQFFYHESCGQCTPCREGTKRMLEVFNWWAAGAGSEDDIKLMDSLTSAMATASRCGLGQFAGVAFKTSLPLFMDEYVAHLKDKVCPNEVCSMVKVHPELVEGQEVK